MTLDTSPRQIRSYLLGTLPGAQAEELEERYVEEGALFDEVCAVEEELIAESLDGRLPPEERARFEGHYLASAGNRRRVAATRAIRERARRGAPVVTLSPAAARRPAARWMALAAAAVLAAVSAFFAVRRPAEVAREARRPAVPGPSDERGPAPERGKPQREAPKLATVTVVLSPLLTRGEERPATLSVPAGGAGVTLRLAGRDGERAPAGELEVGVRTVEGQQVFRGEARAGGDAVPEGVLATAAIPAGALLPDDYLVELSLRSGGRATVLHRYFLRVVPGS